MSRHLFDAALGNNPIRVTMGFDPHTSDFFLIIGWLDSETDSAFAYASDLQRAYDAADWRSIRRFLEKLGIRAPETLWGELAYDAAVKKGCRVVARKTRGLDGCAATCGVRTGNPAQDRRTIMTDQTDISAPGTSGQPSMRLYALAPLYWRLLAVGIRKLSIEYDAKEGIGEVRCRAWNVLGADRQLPTE